MRTFMLFLTIGVAGVVTTACSSQPEQAAQQPAAQESAAAAQPATAEMRNAKGEAVGTIQLTSETGGEGVRLAGEVRNLPAGDHGFHIHTVGKCDPPDFTSAGGHFNPEGHSHSLASKGGHAGDLGNLTVGQDGTANIDLVAQAVTLGEGANSLFKPEGTAIVIHEKTDDLQTDPTGDAGGRLACGVVTR